MKKSNLLSLVVVLLLFFNVPAAEEVPPECWIYTGIEKSCRDLFHGLGLQPQWCESAGACTQDPEDNEVWYCDWQNPLIHTLQMVNPIEWDKPRKKARPAVYPEQGLRADNTLFVCFEYAPCNTRCEVNETTGTYYCNTNELSVDAAIIDDFRLNELAPCYAVQKNQNP